MQPDPFPCRHENVKRAPLWVQGQPQFFCEDCGKDLKGEELPEGPHREYWRGQREAWSGR